MPRAGAMDALVVGVHVLDVLVRPVESIPEGQGGQLGGTAVTLAKLGARVRSAGAIGEDPIGETLVSLLERFGVDTSLLVRRAGVQTSASVLPIRPDGSRPAFHVVGANATYSSADLPREAIAAATHLHLGAPEFMGGEEAARLLRFARERGVVTSADLLAPGEQAAQIRDWVAPAFEHLDYLPSACRALREQGVGCVAATCGADGALVSDAEGEQRVPAFAVEVVDTTGCGDAFSAGFLRARSLGRSHREAALLGCAAAALVVQGLGSDHGDFDLETIERFAAGAHGHANDPQETISR
jgi:sugar/nucleoside kinase (ribokinase family)